MGSECGRFGRAIYTNESFGKCGKFGGRRPPFPRICGSNGRAMRPIRALVDCAALRHNLGVVKGRAPRSANLGGGEGKRLRARAPARRAGARRGRRSRA